MRVGGAGLELSGLDIVREGPVSDGDGSDVTRERTSRNRPNGATTREDEDAYDGNLKDPESEEAGGSSRPSIDSSNAPHPDLLDVRPPAVCP